MQSFDVVIAGGGMVGLALACGLEGSGLRVAVIENHPPKTFQTGHEPYGLRVSAINAASEKLLTYLGVWPLIKNMRASAYQGMDVWDNGSFGQISFSAKEQNVPHLGHIVENNVVRDALWQKAVTLRDVSLLSPSTMTKVVWGENDVFITLNDESMLTARLDIVADGANSWLRSHADIPLTFWDYEHTALVATIRTENPHEGIARQAFNGDSILAFLPLNDPYLCSIVWSQSALDAARRQSIDNLAFEKELAVAFDARLGLCKLESDRLTIPLTGRYARQFAAQRLALLGDAAHTIHPLAGQGVNLGFMDVAMLLGEIKKLHREGKDFGQYLYLREYERNRKHSAALMLAGMQGFRELFEGNNPAKKLLRDVGLVLAGSLPGVKPQLLNHAMGMFDMPKWLAQLQVEAIE